MNTENTTDRPEAFEEFDLDDKYRVTGLLAKGNKGTVYSGMTKLAQRPIAIKILHPEESEKQEALLRFQAAAEIAGSLNHPNIVNVFGSGVTTDGRPYIVMDLLKGESLEDLLKQKGKLDLKTGVDIFLQLAEALNYLHSNNVVHRGLKPKSVILSPDEKDYTVKLIDFEIAKSTFVDRTFATGGSDPRNSLSASPYAAYLYGSPEYIQGKTVDQRSDLYSFACMLFHTLAGRPPYDGKTPVDCMTMHVEENIPDLADYVQDEPGFSEVHSIVKACMRKDPVQRLESFKQVLPGLEKAQKEIEAAREAALAAAQIAKAAAEAQEKHEKKAKLQKNTVYSILSMLIAAGALCTLPYVYDLDLAKIEQKLGKESTKNTSGQAGQEAQARALAAKKVEELSEQVQEAINAGDLAKAKTLAQTAYFTSLSLPEDSPKIPESLALLGKVFELQQNYNGALQAYKWTLSWDESRLGPLAPQTAIMRDKVKAMQTQISKGKQ